MLDGIMEMVGSYTTPEHRVWTSMSMVHSAAMSEYKASMQNVTAHPNVFYLQRLSQLVSQASQYHANHH